MEERALECPSMSEGSYVAYILASSNQTLSLGVTGDLRKRVFSHKLQVHEGFTAEDTCDRLVWYENLPSASAALNREEALKKRSQEQLEAMVTESNPEWKDLSQDWFDSADFEIVFEHASL